MALIEIDHVSFQYPNAPAPALDDISFNINEGERVALVGANGSGKTTLARLLNALYIPTGGSLRVAGMDTRRLELHRAIHQVIGMVFQNPEDQMVAALVEEDLAFGLENLGMPGPEMRRRVDEALQAFDLWEHRRRPPHMLSSGQMQRLALAGVLVVEPRVVIFDETTAMLDPAGRRTVLERINELHQKGTTIITITHFMGEAARCERVIALSHGKVALDGAPAEVFSDAARLDALGLHLPPSAAIAALLRPYLPGLPAGILNSSELLEALPEYSQGRIRTSPVDKTSVSFSAPLALPGRGDGGGGERPSTEATGNEGRIPPTSLEKGGEDNIPPVSSSLLGEDYIRVANLGHIYLKDTPLAHRALQGANMQVRQGEVHGLAGATGSGKSTLLQHLNALILPQEGQVTVGEYRLHEPKVDRFAVRRMAGLSFQNPEVQLFETFVGDEIAYAPRQAGQSREEIRANVRWAMEQVGLDFEGYKDRRSFALSGGEKKKVALASILVRRPQILLLDEPLAGLDPRSRDELLVGLHRLVELGLTLVVSSHQMDDLAGIVDSATVMAHGRDAFSGTVGTVFQREEELDAAGLEAPVAARVALELRRKGWPLPEGLVTPDALLAAVSRLAVWE
jgi:energy-coupling factor transport system ATP-binding protein